MARLNAASSNNNLSADDKDGTATTEVSVEDGLSLRRVGEHIPVSVFLVAVSEVCERFTYRCLTGPLREYRRVSALSWFHF